MLTNFPELYTPDKINPEAFLGLERSLGAGNGNHSSILAWKISWRSLVSCSPWIAKSQTQLSRHTHMYNHSMLIHFFTDIQGQRSLVGCRLWGRTECTPLKRLSSSSIFSVLITVLNARKTVTFIQFCKMDNCQEK